VGIATDKLDQRRAKRRPKPQTDAYVGKHSEFINHDLTKEEKEAYYEWREDIQAVNAAWTAALTDNYRINTKLDEYNDCFASFIIPDDGSDNAGYILAGRGGNALRAVSEALFKHSVIFGGAWRPDGGHGGRENDPDF